MPKIHGSLDSRGIVHFGLFQSHSHGHFTTNGLCWPSGKSKEMRGKPFLLDAKETTLWELLNVLT